MSVIAITGAASGIGAGLADRFAEDGWSVAGCDLDPCTTELAMKADVTDGGDMEAFVTGTLDRFGRLDALIANAGTGRFASIADGEWPDIEDVIRVNLFGVLHSVRAVLRPMRSQGYGRIAVVVSRNAELCPANLVGYNASKASAAAVVRTLSRELEETDILVNGLIPGPTKTPLNPRGTREPDSCYPTAKMLATLPAGGPSGKTFFDEQEYPLFKLFVDETPR